MRLRDIAVIIPAHNEEASLPFVLRDLPQVGNVLVVDNGSTDATVAVSQRYGARVAHERRRGYGSACLKGLAEIERLLRIGETSRPHVVAFLDADYSDYPDMLPLLAEPIFSGRADFVLGSRLIGKREPGAMPLQSVYGNRLACWLMRILWNTRFTDLGPFRAIRYDALRQLKMEDRDFGWTIEMQIKATVAGLRIMEVPVPYRRRIGQSKISGTLGGTIRAGAKIPFTIAKYAWTTRRNVQKNHSHLF